jgi:hypothetical protein
MGGGDTGAAYPMRRKRHAALSGQVFLQVDWRSCRNDNVAVQILDR